MWRPVRVSGESRSRLRVDELEVLVARKRIKNSYIKVDRRSGEVHVSVPLKEDIENVRGFVRSKREWINKHRATLPESCSLTKLKLQDGEMHRVWGREIPLFNKVGPGRCKFDPVLGVLYLFSPESSSLDEKDRVLASWYKREIKIAAPVLFKKWEPVIGVKAGQLSVQRMSSKWGSCNLSNGNIRLNSELAKYPKMVLEHVVVHELVHLVEPGHTKRFYSLMDEFLPNWREIKALMK